MTSTLVIVVKGLNKKANKKNKTKKKKAKDKNPKNKKNHRGNTTEEKNVQNRYLNFSLQGYITFLEFQ